MLLLNWIWNGKITAEKQRAETAESQKVNLSGPNELYGGDFLLADSYLQFGPQWRVKASANGKRLEFQHKRLGADWKLAVPFISPGE